MNAILYSDLRKNLKTHLNHVYDDHEPLIVTRRDNKNLVLLSIDDYNALTETHYLLSSKNNAERLLTSLNKARKGDLKKRELIEG
jgi:antitoxin YefM